LSELPKGAERRLVLRLLNYWRDLLKDEQDSRLFPSFADIDPTSMHDIWQHCFALDLYGHESGPVFRAVGAEFNGYSDENLVNLPISQLDPGSLTALSSQYYSEVLQKSAPISRGGQIDGSNGVQILFRSILLPMSDDGDSISGILGAANCREVVTSPEAIDHEVDSSTAPSKEYDYEII
jgi:hypothetical protein